VRNARGCAGPLNFHYLTSKCLGTGKPAALFGSATLGTRMPRSTLRVKHRHLPWLSNPSVKTWSSAKHPRYLLCFTISCIETVSGNITSIFGHIYNNIDNIKDHSIAMFPCLT
jgi:hypothetical protein